MFCASKSVNQLQWICRLVAETQKPLEIDWVLGRNMRYEIIINPFNEYLTNKGYQFHGAQKVWMQENMSRALTV